MVDRFDIHIQTLPSSEQQDTYKFMSFGFDSALGVKGFQMLINQWLKILLTPQGSDPMDLEAGTYFAELVGASLPLADARDVVVLALDRCNEQVITFQQNDQTLTPSERLANAEMVEFIEQPSSPGFDVTIEISNQAGEQLLLNIPTSTTSQ